MCCSALLHSSLYLHVSQWIAMHCYIVNYGDMHCSAPVSPFSRRQMCRLMDGNRHSTALNYSYLPYCDTALHSILLCTTAQCTPYTAHWKLYIVHCIVPWKLLTVHWRPHTAQFTQNTENCTLYFTEHWEVKLKTVHKKIHSTHCTLHTAHCTLHITHFTPYTVQCKLHTAHCTLHSMACVIYWVAAWSLGDGWPGVDHPYAVRIGQCTLQCAVCSV